MASSVCSVWGIVRRQGSQTLHMAEGQRDNGKEQFQSRGSRSLNYMVPRRDCKDGCEDLGKQLY